jgi:hypothetical protein
MVIKKSIDLTTFERRVKTVFLELLQPKFWQKNNQGDTMSSVKMSEYLLDYANIRQKFSFSLSYSECPNTRHSNT